MRKFRGYALLDDLNGAMVQRSGLVGGAWNNSATTRPQWNASGQLVRVEKWVGTGAHWGAGALALSLGYVGGTVGLCAAGAL